MRLWRGWLPDAVAQEASEQEPLRFGALVSGLTSEWNQKHDAALTLKWLSLFNSYLNAKGDYKSEDLNQAATTLLDILLSCQHNSAAQARWGTATAQLLRTWRNQINITVPWRPLFQFLHGSMQSSTTTYEGPLILETKQSALFCLVRRCRRFFPDGSAEEIWQEIKPSLQNLHTPTAQQALGWLSLFLPTHELSRGGTGWNEMIADWMSLWETDAHNKFWRGQWLLLFAQVAKHDTQGLINWRPHLPRIFNQLQWAFQVPVGTASADPPFSSANSPVAVALFHGQTHTLATTAGKCIIYTLATTLSSAPSSGSPQLARTGSGKMPLKGRDPQGATASADVDEVLSQLEQLVDLLEQYFHPSNNGRWNKYLAKFVNSLCKHLNKRSAKEAAQQTHGAGGTTANDTTSNGTTSNGTTPSQASGFAPSQASGGASKRGRQQLSTQTQRRLAEVIVRMADKAQYSKDNNLAVAACSAFSQMAYVAPDLVLPLIQNRFQVALESVSATHQLVSAIHTLALCTRPLLLAGFAPNTEIAESGDIDADEHKEAGAQAVAGAMMATLPGIDANDPRKTLACFRFYCIVLSSVGMLQGGPGSLPLYAEEWVEELLSRVFGILGNLEAPQTRSDHAAVQGNATTAPTASFLLEGNSMFRPMMELLFARLPPDLQLHAIKQLARFVTTSTLASVTGEASLICNAAAWAAPETCVELLMKPLLARIEDEVKHSASAERLAKVQETTLDWLVGLAAATALHLGPTLLPLKGQIVRVLKALFAAPSKASQSAASKLLSPVLGCLTAHYPLDQFTSEARTPSSSSASHSASRGVHVEAWLGSKDKGSSTDKLRPKWHVPNSAEKKFAQQLVQMFLVDAATQLQQISQGSEPNDKYPKNTIQGLLLQIEGAHHGLRTALADFTVPEGKSPAGQKLALIGSASLSLAGSETRDAVAKSLQKAASFVGANDYETLGILLRVMSGMLSRGAHEFQEAADSYSSWKSDQDVAFDPPLAALLFDQYGGEGKWGRRRPRWLMVERAYLHNLWRASQAAHKGWATQDNPTVPLSCIPPMHKVLVQQLLRFSLHSYKGVRSAAVLALEGCMKQYPAYIMQILPVPLAALAKLPLPEANFEHESHALSPELLSQLSGAMREAAGSGVVAANSKADTLSAADAAKEDSIVHGATSLLRAQSLFRAVSRQPSALAGLVAGLMAGSRYNSPQAQQSILECYLLFALRFIRPPQLAVTQATGGQYPEPIQRMFEDLLHVVGPGQMHWRYSLRADALLLVMLPPADAQAAALLTQHYLRLVVSQLLSQRSLGLTGLLYLLRQDAAWAKGPIKEAIKAEVVKAFQSQANFGKALLEHMAHAHPQPGAASEGSAQSQMQKFMSMSRDDLVVKALSGSFDKWREWPYCVGSPDSIKDQGFMPRQARAVLALAETAPEETLAALQGPLQEALQHAQDEDRARTSAAAEALSGLVACSHAHTSGPNGSAWDKWMKAAFQTSLAGAPLDLAEVWAVAGRFAINALAYSNPKGMDAVLQLIIQQPPSGSPSSAMVKRLKYIGQCLEELSALGITGTDDTNPSHQAELSSGRQVMLRPVVSAEAVQVGRKFQGQFLRELPGLMGQPGEALRHHLAWCGAILCDSLLWQAPCATRHQSSTRLQAMDTDELSTKSATLHLSPAQPQATDIDHDSNAAAARSHAMETDSSGDKERPLLRRDVEAYCDVIVNGMKAGALAVAPDRAGAGGSEPSTPIAPAGPNPMDSDEAILSSTLNTSTQNSESVPQSSATPASEEPSQAAQGPSASDSASDYVMVEAAAAGDAGAALNKSGVTGPSGANESGVTQPDEQQGRGVEGDIANMGFAVQLVIQGLRNGAGPTMMPLLVRLLPYLLKTQELQTPELQPVAMESKGALALLKYLPLQPQVVPQVIETLSSSAHIEPWAARAAGLVFAQYFWFRHCFLLTAQQGQAVQQLVVSMLCDRKLEVQNLAAASLSGLLKGTTPAQFEQLRQHFLGKVNAMFPPKQRTRLSLTPKDSAASMHERHAALLGLRAFVLTSPYDVPPWLPDVLMALVKAANQPAPIKKTVRSTLAEFRRTHEEAGLTEVRKLLTPDQWDAIQDVSSPASYFV